MQIIAAHQDDNPYRKKLVHGLVEYNNKHTSNDDWRYVGFYALDDDGQLAGGVQGNFEYDWLHISHLWVKDAHKGLGKQLMLQAESYAKENLKVGIILDTFAFQARPFYEKMGFAILGTIKKAAGNHERYFLTKYFKG